MNVKISKNINAVLKFEIHAKIGFQLPGSITPEIVRPQLKTAIKSKDRKALDAFVKQSISLGLPGLDADIQEARITLDQLDGGKGG